MVFDVHTFDQLASTNDYVKQHIQTLSHKSVVVAHEQTSGRGRFTRSWLSEPGDVMLTICWKEANLSHWLLSSLAVVRTLKRLEVDASIKWPNDIIVNHRKICGILIESVYFGDHYMGDAIGIGLNVMPKPDGIAIMDVVPRNRSQNISAQNIIPMICEEYEALVQICNTEQLVEEYRQTSYVIGRTVRYHNTSYYARSITKEGLLELQDEHGNVLVVGSQEITLHNVYERDITK